MADEPDPDQITIDTKNLADRLAPVMAEYGEAWTMLSLRAGGGYFLINCQGTEAENLALEELILFHADRIRARRAGE